MGGPTEQETNTVFIPPGEGRQAFSPLPLAWLVENMEIGADGTLESVVGPSILRIGKDGYYNISTGIKASLTPDEFELIYFAPQGENDFVLPEFMPTYGVKSGLPQSIFSANLLNGSARTLLYRIGSRLYRFRGEMTSEIAEPSSNFLTGGPLVPSSEAISPDEVILREISVDPDSKTLDQYVVINDKIIFFNGRDRAQVITYDGMVTPLGFDVPASTLSVSSPSQPDYEEATNYYPNSMGYSWQGRIGTPGDELSGTSAALLKGAWYYYVQYEDIHGNLSEFSAPSDPASIHTNQADPIKVFGVSNRNETNPTLTVGNDGSSASATTLPIGTEIDDLTRRFLVRFSGELPEHAVACRIYRTADTFHKDSTPRLADRIPGSSQFLYDDNNADSDLGETWKELVSVPVFAVACAHQGRLIIGNVAGDTGIVRRSEPGFAGTFPKMDYIYPDSNGDSITALASHRGNLLAFTENSLYLIDDDFMEPQPLSNGIGCVAQKSIQSMRDGSLIWLASDGFYSLSVDGSISKISSSIQKIVDQELNSSQFFRAVSVVDPESNEYRCALPLKGQARNTIFFCFDGNYWRRQSYGLEIADVCAIKDHTKQVMFVGSDPRENRCHAVTPPNRLYNPTGGLRTFNLSRVFVMNRQTTDYFGPPRRIRYRSAWLRSGDYGLVPTNVRNLYIGMLDAWEGKATVRLYRNGSWKPIATMHNVLLYGPDDESNVVVDSASKAIIGKSKVHDPRVFWRQIPVDIQNANSWAFEIELVGSPSPGPTPGVTNGEVLDLLNSDNARDIEITTDKVKLSASREAHAWRKLYRYDDGIPAFNKAKNSKDGHDWELGRLKIHAFAFDVSIATQGSPLARVPFREDK